MSRNEDSAYDRERQDHILDVAIARANIEANMRPRICPFHQVEISVETQECPICCADQGTSCCQWGAEAMAALRGLVRFRDNNGNRCFCEQYTDPEGLQHSGACMDAQEVLRRWDTR
jgi:hypothetical protein